MEYGVGPWRSRSSCSRPPSSEWRLVGGHLLAAVVRPQPGDHRADVAELLGTGRASNDRWPLREVLR